MQSKVECKQEAKNKQRLDPSVHLFLFDFFCTYFMSPLAELRVINAIKKRNSLTTKWSQNAPLHPPRRIDMIGHRILGNVLQNFGLFSLTFILAQFVYVHPGFVVSPKELGTQIGVTTVQQKRHRVGAPTKKGNDMAEMFFFLQFSFPPSLQPITGSEHSGVVIQIWCRYLQCLCRWLTWISSHVVAGP